ncbi:MAG: tripartite tricarboxylate transporter TctB family protein [Deltaproteobacteria bacterium]|nr:tripartite tricarboxylate transporter TctB family protein [Deltaproteobacteria bacterium]
MRKSDIATGLVLTIIGLYLLLVVIPNETTVSDFDIGGTLPSSLFPYISIGLMTGLSILLIIKHLLHAGKEDEDPPMTVKNWLHLLYITGLFVVALVSFTYLGFVLGGIIMIASLMFYMGTRSPLRVALTSILATACIYVFFWYGFHIALPSGKIEWKLFLQAFQTLLH